MKALNNRHSLILWIGDLIVMAFALWFTLLIRYGDIPSRDLFKEHIFAFAPLVLVWLAVFFISGLYERHTVFFLNRLPYLVIKVQIVNSFLAVAFFYFVSYLNIAPKTILFLFLLFSSVALIIWRNFGYRLMGKKNKENALLIGNSDELRELEAEVNQNDLYPIKFISVIDFEHSQTIDFKKYLSDHIHGENVSVIALDIANEKMKPLLPHLYDLVFSNISFINLHKMYEEIFKRVPLSLIRYSWFLENISNRRKPAFDFIKRAMDILIAIPLLLVPIITFPFAFLAMKLEDGGEIFTYQKRIGKNNGTINLIKFRTMMFNDGGDWKEKGRENKVTKTGAFLRKTRLDEFPQLWNVLKGDISLIGPRPEFPDAVKHYEAEIPYYAIRHLIKPGLSGWAQIYGEHPHHGIGAVETMNKLSYDLYYINNRSFMLDLEIALKTIRILLTFKGK